MKWWVRGWGNYEVEQSQRIGFVTCIVINVVKHIQPTYYKKKNNRCRVGITFARSRVRDCLIRHRGANKLIHFDVSNVMTKILFSNAILCKTFEFLTNIFCKLIVCIFRRSSLVPLWPTWTEFGSWCWVAPRSANQVRLYTQRYLFWT